MIRLFEGNFFGCLSDVAQGSRNSCRLAWPRTPRLRQGGRLRQGVIPHSGLRQGGHSSFRSAKGSFPGSAKGVIPHSGSAKGVISSFQGGRCSASSAKGVIPHSGSLLCQGSRFANGVIPRSGLAIHLAHSASKTSYVPLRFQVELRKWGHSSIRARYPSCPLSVENGSAKGVIPHSGVAAPPRAITRLSSRFANGVIPRSGLAIHLAHSASKTSYVPLRFQVDQNYYASFHHLSCSKCREVTRCSPPLPIRSISSLSPNAAGRGPDLYGRVRW